LKLCGEVPSASNQDAETYDAAAELPRPALRKTDYADQETEDCESVEEKTRSIVWSDERHEQAEKYGDAT
jgi:hypothetical protein